MSLVVVKPITVTDAMLVATDVPETDYAAWSSGATYAIGNRVILTSVHKVYESLQAGNTNKNPVTEPTWWIEVSATNRWKLFDLSVSTQTIQSTSMYYEIEPGSAVNAVAALNLTNVGSVTLTMTDPSFGVVYDRTIDLVSVPTESSWYAWFFSERVAQTQVYDLNLPTYPNATLRVEFDGVNDMAVGVLLIGQQRVIGVYTQQGTRVGIQDYSRKELNEFGDVVLVQRAFAKRASFPLFLDNKQLDNTQTLLASLRAAPALWIGSDAYNATSVYGFYKEFDIGINYADYSDCNIDIEGLT